MRTVLSLPRLVISFAAIVTVAACTAQPPAPRSTAVAAEQTAPGLTCAPPKRLCTGCTGEPICAIRCPECPPPDLAPGAPSLTLVAEAETCGTLCRTN